VTVFKLKEKSPKKIAQLLFYYTSERNLLGR